MSNNVFDWSEVCLVGIGSHARRRLIPALQSLANRPVTSVVSRQKLDLNFSFLQFSDLKQALVRASPSTLFIVANPPACHFSSALMILNAGFDVMIEKPGFLTSQELDQLISVALSKKLLLIEMFMYLENNISHAIFKFIKSYRKYIKNIDFNFTLPSLPSNTFRNYTTFEGSLLLDMGCYPLSFFLNAGLSIDDLQYSDISESYTNKSVFKIYGSSSDITLLSYVGCTGRYENTLRIECLNDQFIQINPFFYGVPSDRTISSNCRLFDFYKPCFESCSFTKLFSRSRSSWIIDQNTRFKTMSFLSAKYQEFACQYNG